MRKKSGCGPRRKGPGLKPAVFVALYGAAEAAPFQNNDFFGTL
jgi:hypothetical protein